MSYKKSLVRIYLVIPVMKAVFTFIHASDSFQIGIMSDMYANITVAYIWN